MADRFPELGRTVRILKKQQKLPSLVSWKDKLATILRKFYAEARKQNSVINENND